MINYNNHNITGISYNNHSIKYVYGCGGNLVWSGGTGPTPTTRKFYAEYIGGQTYSAECDGNAELTSATTRPSGYEYTAMTKAIIGDCITTTFASFRDCISLTSVGSIGSGASVEIPSSVTGLGGQYGKGTFQNCSGLTSVNLPNTITDLGQDLFLNCANLSSVRLSDNVTGIAQGCFDSCVSLQSLDISNTKAGGIGDNAFFKCTGLTSIITPTTLKSVSDEAFSGCTNLLSFNAPNVNYIGADAFNNCTSLSSVTVSNNYPAFTLANTAFLGCTNLKRLNSNVDGVINIPNVNYLRVMIFYGCTSITTVNIPSGITSIGQGCFSNCSGLTTVKVEATTPPTLGASVFDGTNLQNIYVPSASVETYKTSGWSDFASIIQPIP